jgi:hypothetical protein
VVEAARAVIGLPEHRDERFDRLGRRDAPERLQRRLPDDRHVLGRKRHDGIDRVRSVQAPERPKRFEAHLTDVVAQLQKERL